MAIDLDMDTCDTCNKEIEAVPHGEVVRCEDCWAKHWDDYKKPSPTNKCTCLDSPNMLAGPCQHCEEWAGNDYLTANKLAAISTALMSDTPVSMAASTLPEGHALDTAAYRDAIRAVKKIIELRNRVAELEARIPPAQAEPVAVCECGKQYAKIDGVTYCPDCTTAMTGLTEEELSQALAEPAWAVEQIVQGVPKAEPVKAKEPWKPRMGEKVLVEALVRKVYRDMTVCVDIFDVNNDSDWAIVNLSQLRPLPVVQGEGVGK